MMSDVAQSIGISQGLPYRYFKSKLELLDAVAAKMGMEFIKTVVGFKFKPGMNAREKLDVYFKLFEDIGSTKLVSTLHGNDSKDIHKRLSEKTFKAVLPHLKNLIEEGRQQKVFDCPHADETAVFLIYGSMSVHDMVNVPNMHEKIEIIKQLFYRVLGVR